MLLRIFPYLLQLMFPSVTWKVKTNTKSVYLTFDDGPHPRITDWVLKELSRYNAKATFFCVGENIQKYPETYASIVARGHQIGNHTFNHLNGWKTPNLTYYENIEKCELLTDTGFYRPPYGRLTLWQWLYLRKKYTLVMWSILTHDYNKKLHKDKSLRSILSAIEPGSVIVFHDSEKAEDNLKYLLPQVIQYLHQHQYEMKTL